MGESSNIDLTNRINVLSESFEEISDNFNVFLNNQLSQVQEMREEEEEGDLAIPMASSTPLKPPRKSLSPYKFDGHETTDGWKKHILEMHGIRDIWYTDGGPKFYDSFKNRLETFKGYPKNPVCI